jgi:chromate reductase
MTHTLFGLCGSLRRAASNRKLLNEAARLFGPAQYGEGDLNLPLYDGDLEASDGIPDAVQSLAAQIAAADAVIISCPEYNKGPSGVLKNALDWISRTKDNPWRGKPVAVMTAAAGRAGGEGAQTMLRANMNPFQPRLVSGPAVHLAASNDAFDSEGQLISSHYRDTLQALMDKLRAEIAR